MNTQSYSWQQEFINCLELGTTKVQLASYFENIVEFMRGYDNPDSSLNRLIEAHSLDWVLLRYEEFLDRLFLSELAACNAFPIGLSSEKAKVRFRQLMRVFHPDRGAHEEAWLNYRAERINQAYKDYQTKKTAKPASIKANISEQNLATPTSAAYQINSKIKYKPNALREKFGNADQVQRRIVFALCLVASILVFLVFLSSSDPMDSAAIAEDQVVLDGVQSTLDIVEKENENTFDLQTKKAKEILAEAPWLEEENTDFEVVDVGISETDTFKDSGNSNFSSFDTNLEKGEPLSNSKVFSIDKKTSSGLSENIDRRNISSINKKSVSSIPPHSIRSARVVSKPKVEIAKKIELDKPSPQSRSNDGKKDVAEPIQKKSLSSSKVTQSKWSNPSPKSCDFSIGEKLPLNTVRMKVIVGSSIRQGPNVSCKILDDISRGEEVKVLQRVLQQDGQWFNIESTRLGVASQGWVYGELLEAVEDKKIVSEPVLAASNDANKHAEDKNAKDSVNIVLEEVLGVLDKLQIAYESGDVAQLAEQYTSRGRENFIIGNSALKRFYNWQFPRTYARKLQFNVNSHNFVSATEVRLKGTAFTSYKFVKNDKVKVRTANAKFIFVKVGDTFKIKSFDWKKI